MKLGERSLEKDIEIIALLSELTYKLRIYIMNRLQITREGEILLSDSELLQLFGVKPEKALDKMINIYAGLVYTIASDKLSLMCSKEDIEECVSDVFYGVYRQREAIDLQKGSIKAFIAVVAKRKAIDIYRSLKNKNNKIVHLEDTLCENTIQNNVNIEQVVIEKEVQDVIIKEIKALGEPDSQIFIRKYYFGQSTKLIAKVLGIKENTIDKKVSRGLVKLREVLGGVL
jgi:RNA polymerase sigma-70 factor, ECF subfamily